MQNITMTLKDKKLTLVIDLAKEIGPSSSGKSTLIASTGGNIEVTGAEGVKLGINCYRK